MTSRDQQSGMTLVEIMVVIAIMGIIANLAISKFAPFRLKAQRSEMYSNLNALEILGQTYAGGHDAFPPVEYPQSGGYQIFTSYTPDPADGCNGAAVSNGCNCQNILGFGVASCSKARYTYAFAAPSRGGGNPVPRHYFYAWSNKNMCPDAGTILDYWTISDKDLDASSSYFWNYVNGTILGGTCTDSGTAFGTAYQAWPY